MVWLWSGAGVGEGVGQGVGEVGDGLMDGREHSNRPARGEARVVTAHGGRRCTSGRCGAKRVQVSGSCSCQYASRAAPSSSARSLSISPIQSAR